LNFLNNTQTVTAVVLRLFCPQKRHWPCDPDSTSFYSGPQ